MLPNAVRGPYSLIQVFTACRSFGLFLRTPTAISPPVRTATSVCAGCSGNTCCQNSATKSSTTVISTRPAFTISRMSSSSSASGRLLDRHRRLAAAGKRLVQPLEAFEVAAALPDEHFAAGQVVGRRGRRHAGAGDDDLRHAGARRRAEVDELSALRRDRQRRRDEVDLARHWSAGNSWSRASGTMATWTLSSPVFSRLFSCSSNSLSDS